jgi:molybdopterin synthase sulfur carrier subunit
MADDLNPAVTILYFAWLRDRAGISEERLAGVRTVGDLLAWLAERSPKHRAAFENRKSIRCAVNQDFADPTAPVGPGDEVAFFPPVTGG